LTKRAAVRKMRGSLKHWYHQVH